MKDDDIWRRLYYQRFVSEEARRSGKVPVLVDGGIYCKHLDKCGCKKYAPGGDVHDSDHDNDSDHDRDHDHDVYDDRDEDSGHGHASGSDYDDYYDNDNGCFGETDEDCGLFSTWWNVYWAELRLMVSTAQLNSEMDRLWNSVLRGEGERNYVGAPNWWMRSWN
jgi:hypothetical protein